MATEVRLRSAFGNIKKDATVGTSFQPTYNQKKNWISALPGCTISYDANGNPLQDCARGTQDTYTWDSEGKAITLDAVTVVYDALGRGVERRATVNPTFYSPILYTPGGQKFASLVTYPGNPIKLSGLFSTYAYRFQLCGLAGSSAASPAGSGSYQRPVIGL